jgi:hypothetical protein
MATSVKMDDDIKRRLDRLREELSIMEGRSVTAMDLLAALVARGEKDRDGLLSEISGIHYPLPASRFKQTLALVGDFGETSPEDIDRTLYGGKSRRRY